MSFIRTSRSPRSSFTLIELLVVIAIIAILAVVVVLTLNPAQLLMQGRDSGRVSDLANITTVLNLFLADQPGASLGNTSTTYLSIPDPTATTTAGTNCAGLNLTPPANWTYHCPASSTYRAADGTGWIPVNFRSISAGSPLGILPVDPANTSSSALYYAYTPGGSTFALTAGMESQKYLQTAKSDGGVDPARYEAGSNLSLVSPSEGLVGLWTLDEGSGTSAFDASGNGNTGTWSGTLPYYTSSSKVGAYAGSFDGSTDCVVMPSSTSLNNIGTLASPNYSVAFWVKTLSENDFLEKWNAGGYPFAFRGSGLGMRWGIYDGVHNPGLTSAATAIDNTWHHVVGVRNTTALSMYIYIDGSFSGSASDTTVGSNVSSPGQFSVGDRFSNCSVDWISGSIDDVRIYSRAFTSAEVQALYNAEK
jgi:prepilin-type N-terminal cleavage/methylation domain-containing protein